MQLGFSSKFLLDLKLPELTSAQFSRLTDWGISVGWKMIILWLFDSSHLRRVEEPVNKLDLAASAPSPFVYLVMNSYLGLEGCTAAILSVFL